MRRVFALGLMAASVLGLSGCSSLDANQVSVDASAGAFKYALVGDLASFDASISLQGDRGDSYRATLQVRDESNKWSEVASTELSGDASTKFETKLPTPGEFTYRVAVTDTANKVLKESKAFQVTVNDLALGVRTLYYNEAQACSNSDSCFDFRLRNTYPGLYELPIAAATKAKASYSWTAQGVPDVSSITPDPNWVIPVRPCMAKYYKLDISKPLPGRTFIVTVGDHQSHVTYLNGKFYYYAWFCH